MLGQIDRDSTVLTTIYKIQFISFFLQFSMFLMGKAGRAIQSKTLSSTIGAKLILIFSSNVPNIFSIVTRDTRDQVHYFFAYMA